MTKDSIVHITYPQLVKTNLIFAEHAKLKIENEILLSEVEVFKQIREHSLRKDSLNLALISSLKVNLSKSEEQVVSLTEDYEKEKDRKRKARKWAGAGWLASVGLLILLIVQN